MKLNYKIEDDQMYIEGDYSKEKRMDRNITLTFVFIGISLFVALLVWASLTGTTLQ